MVDTGPIGRIAADGKSVIEVDLATTDDDLEWLNRNAFGNYRFERARPTVDVEPDPRLARRVQR